MNINMPTVLPLPICVYPYNAYPYNAYAYSLRICLCEILSSMLLNFLPIFAHHFREIMPSIKHHRTHNLECIMLHNSFKHAFILIDFYSYSFYTLYIFDASYFAVHIYSI